MQEQDSNLYQQPAGAAPMSNDKASQGFLLQLIDANWVQCEFTKSPLISGEVARSAAINAELLLLNCEQNEYLISRKAKLSCQLDRTRLEHPNF